MRYTVMLQQERMNIAVPARYSVWVLTCRSRRCRLVGYLATSDFVIVRIVNHAPHYVARVVVERGFALGAEHLGASADTGNADSAAGTRAAVTENRPDGGDGGRITRVCVGIPL